VLNEAEIEATSRLENDKIQRNYNYCEYHQFYLKRVDETVTLIFEIALLSDLKNSEIVDFF
jgi:hypothetical protein